MRGRLEGVDGAEALRKAVALVFARAEIQEVHHELGPDTVDRVDWRQAVNEAAEALSRRTLARLEGDPGACDAFVTVSSSHAGFPSLSRQLQEQAGFPLDARCFDLHGAGCSGPAQGLQLADLLLRTGAARRVCVLCVDVMGSYGQLRRFSQPPSMEELVAHCLASDGAAALVMSIQPGPHLSYLGLSAHERLWSASLDQNALAASADNQPYLAVGKNIRTRLVEETSGWFAERCSDEVVLMHPGGAALMARVTEAQPDRAASVDISRTVLREHGNLGAPSVLFVLREALARRLPLGSRLTLFALGPGIVTTAVTLDALEGAA
ncbi:MAG: hypothetical protein AAFU79_22285, partial [Myxococcota bacterium]